MYHWEVQDQAGPAARRFSCLVTKHLLLAKRPKLNPTVDDTSSRKSLQMLQTDLDVFSLLPKYLRCLSQC